MSSLRGLKMKILHGLRENMLNNDLVPKYIIYIYIYIYIYFFKKKRKPVTLGL